MRKQTELEVLLEIRDLLKNKTSVEAKEERFLQLFDGWIKDVQTGLEWGPSSDKSMKWEEAKKFCADQGGRLPNVTELFSLVDRTKHNPATLIPGMKSEWYWTDESVAWSSGYAWSVSFDVGNVSYDSKGSFDYVRPVRSSQ